MLVPGIVILFDGTHASIPSGWSRETSLDAKFPKSSGAEAPNTTGGSATHTHTSTGHTHTLNNHTHTFTVNAWSNSPTDGSDKTSVPSEANKSLQGSHTHSGTTGNPTGGTTVATAVTYGAVSNNPNYYEFVPIISTAYNFVPVNGVMLSKNTSRAGLTFHAGSANKYVRFAGTGNNAGSTGGSTTNTHSIDHTHTTNTHTHSATSGGGTPLNRHGYGSGSMTGDHTHTFTTDGGSAPIDAVSENYVTSETVEPAYATLNAYKNDGASSVLPQPSDIALWLGSHASVPIGWLLCDGNNGTPNLVDKFIKLNSVAGASTTGGSNTHAHASHTHSHSSSAHSHTAADQTGVGTLYSSDDINLTISKSPGSHSVTVASSAGSYATGTTTADSSSNEPEYRTVAYIQLQFLTGGSAITKLIN